MDDADTTSTSLPLGEDNALTIGMEEELFLVDHETWDCVGVMPEAFRKEAQEALGDRFQLEIIASMVEIVTRPNGSLSELARELKSLRSTLAAIAERHGLAVLALGTHPFSDWKDQTLTPKPRYDRIATSLQILSTRVHACGLHVHAAIPDPEDRISAMNRMQRYLPVFLALSTSSPFWRGEPTGLKGYRTAANNETPRSGLPARFASFDEFERYVGRLTRAGFIPDPSYLWWAIRPSARFATLELRIMDCCTRVEDSIALAALYCALLHHLLEDPAFASEWESHHQLINDENRWQATRYGIEAKLLDPVTGECAPVAGLARDLMRMLDGSARTLGCLEDMHGIDDILARGTSADRQLRIFAETLAGGASRLDAARRVAADAANQTVGA